MQRLSGFLFLIGLLFGVFAARARAHNLNLTGVKVRIEKTEVTVSVVAHLHSLKSKNPAAEIAGRLRLRIDDRPFSALNPQLIRDPANGIVIWQGQQARIQPQTPPAQNSATLVALDAPIFPELAGQTTVLTVFEDRQTRGEAILDADHPTAVIGEAKSGPNVSDVLLRFARLGIEHIVGGIDHLLFLLSLLLLGGSWQQLLKIVTAFTLAHSLTLSLAATGIYSLSPRLVEPVIALSIVIVALANLRFSGAQKSEKQLDPRPFLAFGFGLIHGFGFAGALAEVGLPREALGWALLAFNGGVEVGQAALVLIFAPALAILVKRWPGVRVPMVHYGSATVAIVGAFWFVERVLAV